MAFRVAQAEALVEQRDTFAQVTVDFGAQVVVAVQGLSQDAVGHGFGHWFGPKKPVHGCGPVHVTAGQVPAPDTATGQRLGQLFC